ncbi:hypothetical protein HII31_03695 [Pseudocercospora fuligena]|uniref:Uncharacterized protein n=1 Tax=Pseudocercospora fuligena TaxID=685502 RepID=A0A8H6RRQ9_9PEZI|nr:hypothetical protein HII31_03695 [Pseudocercospora fuligena]
MKNYYFDFPSLGEQEGERADSFDFSKEVRAALDDVSKRINAEAEADEKARQEASHDRKDSKQGPRHGIYPAHYDYRMEEREQRPAPETSSSRFVAHQSIVQPGGGVDMNDPAWEKLKPSIEAKDDGAASKHDSQQPADEIAAGPASSQDDQSSAASAPGRTEEGQEPAAGVDVHERS